MSSEALKRLRVLAEATEDTGWWPPAENFAPVFEYEADRLFAAAFSPDVVLRVFAELHTVAQERDEAQRLMSQREDYLDRTLEDTRADLAAARAREQRRVEAWEAAIEADRQKMLSPYVQARVTDENTSYHDGYAAAKAESIMAARAALAAEPAADNETSANATTRIPGAPPIPTSAADEPSTAPACICGAAHGSWHSPECSAHLKAAYDAAADEPGEQ